MYDAWGKVLDGLLLGLKFTIPLALLGIWKLVEIIIWIFKHVSITFS